MIFLTAQQAAWLTVPVRKKCPAARSDCCYCQLNSDTDYNTNVKLNVQVRAWLLTVLLWFHILYCEIRLEIMNINWHSLKTLKQLYLELWTASFISIGDLVSYSLTNFFCPGGISISYEHVSFLSAAAVQAHGLRQGSEAPFLWSFWHVSVTAVGQVWLKIPSISESGQQR